MPQIRSLIRLGSQAAKTQQDMTGTDRMEIS
jgi:hypothetical protein